MDMSGGASTGVTCQISMLWNWYTIDACFLARSWHIATNAQFAGSVIGVFFLVIAIEATRRLGREYDRRLVSAAAIARKVAPSTPGEETPVLGTGEVLKRYAPRFVPSWPQQVLRGLIYGSQFTAAFLVMLLGMYYNGYILFAIFIGQTVGYIAFGRDTCLGGEDVASGSCC